MKVISREEMFEPLHKYIPKYMWDDMSFNEITDNGIFLYKHCQTRQYINVDKDGIFYRYLGSNSYEKIDKERAIRNLDLDDRYMDTNTRAKNIQIEYESLEDDKVWYANKEDKIFDVVGRDLDQMIFFVNYEVQIKIVPFEHCNVIGDREVLIR